MVIEVVAYELVTTLAGWFGIKLLTGASLKQRMQGIAQPKKLPFIDKYLKKELGTLSKREQWISVKAVKAIRRITQYEAFRLLLIFGGRKMYASKLEKGSNHLVCTRGQHTWRLLDSQVANTATRPQ